MRVLARLVAFCGGLVFSAASSGTAVFINEIHYDNTGTDTGEFVEIAGPAGTDLSGWSVVRYNGSTSTVYTSPTANPSGSDVLSGLIPDLGSGFGVVTVNYLSNGLQNGSPDGLALVDDMGSVVQFLSYEGSFTAASGPAAGLTSADIGVSEPFDTPVGNSLQLRGVGSEYEDFGWDSATANTAGEFNTLQTFTTDTGTLVINEIDYDQAGTDAAEFLEILNVSDRDIDLDPYSVVFRNGANDSTYRTLDLPMVTLASGDYFVICANSATVINCDLDGSPDTNFIQNGAPDALALLLNGVVIDTVSYEGETTGFTEGSGGAPTDNPDIMFRGISRLPDGADSDDNAFDFKPACITPGTANTMQDSGCVEPTVPEVPEPATLGMLALGLFGAGYAKRRRSH